MLTPRLRERALWCAQRVLAAREAGEYPGRPQRWNYELVKALELWVATSGAGTGTPCGDGQSEAKVPISTRQAADIIGCSSRYVREIAAEQLGGVQIDGGRWLLNEDKVRVYAEGRDTCSS